MCDLEPETLSATEGKNNVLRDCCELFDIVSAGSSLLGLLSRGLIQLYIVGATAIAHFAIGVKFTSERRTGARAAPGTSVFPTGYEPKSANLSERLADED